MSRYGFTTGSCSAAAAKAAAYMLLTGKSKEEISIITPKGITYDAQILDIKREENKVSCCVIKDGGDDPDITSGAHIYCEVSFSSKDASALRDVLIEGGEGVGRVTKPGLDQKPGFAAINSVPRQMIKKEVLEVMELCDYSGILKVVISVPEGACLSQKTFNPRLGIVGGISILGTSGIVEPMSMEAIVETIRVELKQRKALGDTIISVAPGNYGLDFMKRTFDFDLDKSVKCSNFIGDTIDMARELEFKGMLLTGHIGKLVKLAGGMMNTHSKYGDCRMDLISSCLAQNNGDISTINKILNCVVCEDAIDLLDSVGKRTAVMNTLLKRIMFHLTKKAGENFPIECIVYSNKHGILAQSDNAISLLNAIKEQNQYPPD